MVFLKKKFAVAFRKNTTNIYLMARRTDMERYFWAKKQKSPLRDSSALAQSGYPPPSEWITHSIAGIGCKIHRLWISLNKPYFIDFYEN